MDYISMKSLDKFFKEFSLFHEDKLRKKNKLPLLDDEKKDLRNNSILCKRCNNNRYIELRRLRIQEVMKRSL
ncbi:hypothetical protein U3516DRAFT_756510 [Neocallimastix sp. 'constans']